ncbi:MAG TPA: hypothetical protein VIS74_07115 [Chthoniobacterales bacterium]
MKLLFESLIVIALAALVAVASWGFRAKALSGRIHYGVPTLTRAAAGRLERAGKPTLWVEVRAEGAFSKSQGHVLHLATWENDLSHLLESWTPGDVIVVTGDPKFREATRKAAERLDRAGLPSVHLLAWEGAQ